MDPTTIAALIGVGTKLLEVVMPLVTTFIAQHAGREAAGKFLADLREQAERALAKLDADHAAAVDKAKAELGIAP